MKAFILTLFIFSFVSIGSVNGQVLKIHAGTSISSLDWHVKYTSRNMGTDLDLFNETLTNVFLFAGVEFYQGSFVNLSGNFGYIRKGGIEELQETVLGDAVPRTSEHPADLDYLVINSTADFFYRLTPALYPFLSVGPRVDFVISSNQMFESIKNINELNSINYGLVLGFGINYDIARFQIGLRTEHFLNFTDIANWRNDDGDSSGRINDQLFTLGLTLGYRL
jgi:hypothetical protein